MLPGATCCFEAIASGDLWGITAYNTYGYAGGTIISKGSANSSSDLWFREGIVVPEPTVLTLLVIGGTLMARCSRKRRG